MSTFHTRGAVAPTATVPTTVRPKTDGTTMSTTTKQKTLFAASAAAISAIGLLTGPAPAQAEPMLPLDCDKYEFAGGDLRIDQDNNLRVLIHGTGQQISGPASYGPQSENIFETEEKRRNTTHGSAEGGITGRTITFSANWTGGPGAGLTNFYTGQVNDDGGAGGTTSNNLGTTNGWSAAAGSFRCDDGAGDGAPPVAWPPWLQ